MTAHSQDVMYDLAIAIIFLCELDPDQYRQEILSLTQVDAGLAEELWRLGLSGRVHT